jgi:WD40 repeat protein
VTADDARQNAEQTATIAVAGALATAALLNKETRPDLSALLAVEALNRADNFQSRNALLSTLQANPSLRTHLHATDKVGTVAFSPDGRRLAAGDNRGVTLWDVGAGRSEGATFATKEEGYIQTMAFNPDGSTLALATADHAVRFWDVRRRQFIGDPITDRTAAFRSLAFSADGRVLVTVSELGVSEWTVATQTLRRQAIDFSLPENYVLLCRISPDGRMMASGHEDGTIRVWDVATGKADGDPLRGQSNVFALAFSGDGKRLASGHSDHTVRVWDLVTRRALGPALAGHSRQVMRIAFSPKGDTVASAGLDGVIRRWDVASQRPVGEPLQSHGSVRALTFSADGETLASTDDEAGVHLWDVRNRRGLGQRLNASSEGILYALAVSPDETRMVTASTADDRNSPESTTTVRLWNLLTRQPVGAPLSRGNDVVASAAFSPDSKMFALASDKIELFDVSTRHRVGDLSSTAGGQALSVAFSRDGKMLAAGFEEGEVQLWTMPGRRAIGDPVTGREHGGTVRTVAFTPDGRILAFAGTDGLVRLWDVRRRTLLSELKGDTGAVLGLAFSPDGRVLASTSGDRAIRLWDIVAGQPIAEAMNAPTRSSARLGTVAFTQDGTMLASTVAEGAVRLWDAGTGQPVGEPLRGHTADVMRAAFASGGRTLLSAGTDGAIWAWDVSVESWRARACRMANRDLSLTEWRQYVGNDVPYRRTCSTPNTVSHSRP